jgi:hypothetical protein
MKYNQYFQKKKFYLWVKNFESITNPPILKPHCIRCSHFKVDDVSALEPSSKPTVRIVEDRVTASATYAMTLVTAWML